MGGATTLIHKLLLTTSVWRTVLLLFVVSTVRSCAVTRCVEQIRYVGKE